MSRWILCAVAALAPAASAQSLKVGDAAPKLAVGAFVKGEAVTGFASGKVYVVEFWATWCGPCLTTIPHLTALQRKYKDVTVIGVAVWEQKPADVKPFVAKMGDKMDYRVAIDAVPAGATPDEGAMAKTWMTAAGQDGIPAAFIVDGAGKVAWIGHPAEMDKVLEQVVAGKYDVNTAKRAAQMREKMVAFQGKARAVAKDAPALLKLVNETIAADAEMERELGGLKLSMLRSSGKTSEAVEYGERLVAKVLHDDAESLNNVAWGICDPDAKTPPSKELAALALAAAKRADELTGGKNASFLDTLAAAHFAAGDAAKAAELQEKAIRLLPPETAKDDIEEIKARLTKYRAAAK